MVDELISKNVLYKQVAELEELARKRYLDTPSNSPCAPRYAAQMQERTRFKHMVADAPAVDAVPVVHGRWEATDIIAKKAGYGVRYYRHAECKINPCRLFECTSDYCPNCGAKMDLEVKP